MSDDSNRLDSMDVIPTGAALGAEITGPDLSRPLPAETVAALRAAVLEHGVVFFRGQSLDDAAQLAFTRYFGPASVHIRDNQPDRPTDEIMMVSNVRENGKPIGSLGHGEIRFHSDLSYMPHPGTFSILYAVEIPAAGGATSWCNNSAAYDGLDDAMKVRLDGLRATHLHFRPEQNPDPSVDHPIVCTHPETGHKTLFVSPYFTKSVVGMAEDEGQTLLDTLFAHQTRDAYIWAHHWRVGDLVMWDNRATMHRREPFPDSQRRILKRTQIFSETRPVA
ncbi:MAG: TauD/TfdA family dioxygenase [Rhodospirillaceae bacterium]|nr:TauD/TfdA family dioxygenase [Rhodospirillaceae bacterium]MDD9915180.1 TauD/TfdA family dioxygenase [Rhodospirillaceae bacterium]MDD9925517.1 TauD/TfdA family dioxygenase [Rhodospirillaceae bacterium]